MVDLEGFYEQSVYSEKPKLLKSDDCRKWGSDCQCIACRDRRKNVEEGSSFFIRYHDITPLQWEEGLTDHQYLLCPYEIRAFAFRTRSWGKYPYNKFCLR